MPTEFLNDESYKDKGELRKIIKEIDKQQFPVSRAIFLKRFILALIKAQREKKDIKEKPKEKIERKEVKEIKSPEVKPKEATKIEQEFTPPEPEEKEKPLTGAPIPVKEGHSQIEYDLEDHELKAPKP